MKICNCLPNFQLCPKNNRRRRLCGLSRVLFYHLLARQDHTLDLRRRDGSRTTRPHNIPERCRLARIRPSRPGLSLRSFARACCCSAELAVLHWVTVLGRGLHRAMTAKWLGEVSSNLRYTKDIM